MNFLQFQPQCCDAERYLKLGSGCAEGLNGCYDPLRPMGSVLWFSIPYRLGLPPEYIILGNLLLMSTSIVLSWLVMVRILEATEPHAPRSKALRSFSLFGFSAFAHLLFFSPVLFNSLSDTPAAGFALSAVWVFLLSRLNHSTVLLGISGILFGMAAMFRVYYLVPVLMVLVAFVIVWTKQRRFGELVFLLAVLPILFQCLATYRTQGQINYLGNEPMSRWSSIHLKTSAIGYDTLLPAQKHFWKLSGDESASSLPLWQGKLVDIVRVYAGKIYFYFGSYAAKSYLFANDGKSEAAGMRTWSKTMLVVNLCVILGAVPGFLKLARLLGPEMYIAFTAAVTFIGLGLLIVPEQRFIIAFEVMMSIFFVLAISMHWRSRK